MPQNIRIIKIEPSQDRPSLLTIPTPPQLTTPAAVLCATSTPKTTTAVDTQNCTMTNNSSNSNSRTSSSKHSTTAAIIVMDTTIHLRRLLRATLPTVLTSHTPFRRLVRHSGMGAMVASTLLMEVILQTCTTHLHPRPPPLCQLRRSRPSIPITYTNSNNSSNNNNMVIMNMTIRSRAATVDSTNNNSSNPTILSMHHTLRSTTSTLCKSLYLCLCFISGFSCLFVRGTFTKREREKVGGREARF
ncbi:hypothetical protein BKA57DRAFT_125398 [Linnemannia elongata]|nr:hypothetical protein BKA57DRAFT_125398 [Linnemannia elongata]